MNLLEKLTNFMSQKSIRVPEDWLEACIDHVNQENHGGVSVDKMCNLVYQQWLFANLEEISTSTLPTCISKASRYMLNGRHCLQMNSYFDASTSAYSQYQKMTGSENENALVTADDDLNTNFKDKNGKRALIFELTDGTTKFRAFEYKPIPHLKAETLLPGCKVVLDGKILCRKGMALLSSENIQLLGGHVEELLQSCNVKSLLANKITAAKNCKPGSINFTTPNLPIMDSSSKENVTPSSTTIGTTVPVVNSRSIIIPDHNSEPNRSINYNQPVQQRAIPNRPIPNYDNSRQNHNLPNQSINDQRRMLQQNGVSRDSVSEFTVATVSSRQNYSARYVPKAMITPPKNDAFQKREPSFSQNEVIQLDDDDDFELGDFTEFDSNPDRNSFSNQPGSSSITTMHENRVDNKSSSNSMIGPNETMAFGEIVSEEQLAMQVYNEEDFLNDNYDHDEMNQFPQELEFEDYLQPGQGGDVINISIPPTPPLSSLLVQSKDGKFELHFDPTNGICLQRNAKNDPKNVLSISSSTSAPKNDRLDQFKLDRLCEVLKRTQDSHSSVHPVVFVVKGTVVKIVQPLGVINDRWFCVVKISDGTCCLDCEVGNDFITELFGMTTREAEVIRDSSFEEAKKAANRKLQESIGFLRNFDGLIQIESAYRVNLPTVIKLKSLTSEECTLLQEKYSKEMC